MYCLSPMDDKGPVHLMDIFFSIIELGFRVRFL